MNIPNYALFELGFGYKYQYLISALIHAVITNNISYENAKKFMRKVIDKQSIHADPKKFIEQIQAILPDANELIYNENSFLMLEGEHSCFEDINLFTTNSSNSLVRFIQVKGSLAESHQSALNNAVIKTLINTFNNENIKLPFQLIILLNNNVSNHFFLQTDEDKKKIIVSLIKKFSFMEKFKKDHKALYVDFLFLIDKYIKDSYIISKNQTLHMPLYFQLESPKYYPIYEAIILDNSLYKVINTFKNILDNTKIIESLDHRLVYIFLKYLYGNDKLTKILWNIEMLSMNGAPINIETITNQLHFIKFEKKYINRMKFSKKQNSFNNKFKIGKVL